MAQASLLDRLLQPGSLRAVFQPVVDFGRAGCPVRYQEGLVRGPRGTNVERPDVLFEYARRKLAEAEVDRAALRAVLGAVRAGRGGALGLNVHRSTVAHDPGFVAFLADTLARARVEPGAVVLELVEHGELCDMRALLRRLDELRGTGMRVAIDDFGTGQANYMMLLECRPDYVKIDRRFVHGCHADERRQAFLDSLVALGGRVGAQLVAEGVELPEDLERVRLSGIELVQGFLLARPSARAWQAGKHCA